MNIFLTGGSGFIGRNIVEQMGDQYNIIAPGHSELDLLDEKAVKDFFRNRHIDVVIHSAVKPGHRNAVDLSGLFYSNTRMFFNLMRNAQQFGKMIFLSSGSVYDIRNSLIKVPEEFMGECVPEDEHGFSKYVCSRYAAELDRVVELRLFGVFGKYEDYAIRFISNAICKALFDLPITIKQNRKFDYLFIDDLMPVLNYFIQTETGYKAYNVTPDESVELLSIAEMVKQISGKELPVKVALPGLGPEYSGSNKRLYSEIPGLRFRPLAEAVEKLYQWYFDRRTQIDRQCLLFDK